MNFGANGFVYLNKKQLSKLKWKYVTIGTVIGMVSVWILDAIFK